MILMNVLVCAAAMCTQVALLEPLPPRTMEQCKADIPIVKPYMERDHKELLVDGKVIKLECFEEKG
jgi:hypothetical protein